ncbi:MAG TPA: tRNA (N6-threonylcarbamoyladenosine(37)-N6)-methyltransferase TrmO [Firmicutes bacterium]|nr:tRNA (N6-threonylcarbamoyladenosine(37)-N6)-methyltransferase TrmO [Bacillota bacterium]
MSGNDTYAAKVIAHIRSDFPTKFGLPRQSGLADTEARIVFTPPYRNPDALRGLEDFSHIWLIWEFSGALREDWSPTVRPPRLGGNRRMGVFATRSPFRPNALGLSAVRLEEIRLHTEEGPQLLVSGADLMDGTPIFDIKPYLPYADCLPDAVGGFTDKTAFSHLAVDFPAPLLERIPSEKREALKQVLAQDPRPAYQKDSRRVYGFAFAGAEIRFRVEGEKLYVLEVEPAGKD